MTMRKMSDAAVADRAEQRQFAPALQHVAQHDGGQPERAHEQAETTERLKRGEVGVLDRVKLGEPRGGALDVGAEVAGALLEAPEPAVDEQEPIPSCSGNRRTKFASAITSSR